MDLIGRYQMFSPFHRSWLHRRHAQKLDVVAADLDSIQAACPAAVCDPLFAGYRRRADAGALRRRPGRKPLSSKGYLRLWAARFAIEEETATIWERRRAGLVPRERSDQPPCIQAAELVSRQFRFNVTPEGLHNCLSRGGFR